MRYKISYTRHLSIFFFLILLTFNYVIANPNLPPSLPKLNNIENINNSVEHTSFLDKIKSSFNGFLNIFKKDKVQAKTIEPIITELKQTIENEIDSSEVVIPSLPKDAKSRNDILPAIQPISETLNIHEIVETKETQELEPGVESKLADLPEIPQILEKNTKLETSNTSSENLVVKSNLIKSENIIDNHIIITEPIKKDRISSQSEKKLDLPKKNTNIPNNNDEPKPIFIVPVETKIDTIKIPDAPAPDQVIVVKTEIIQNNLNKIDESLTKFISNETQMLLLPNDDIVLGNISMETKLELMNISEYFSYIEKEQEKIKFSNIRENLNNYVKNYKKNFYHLSKNNVKNFTDLFEEASDYINNNKIQDLRILLENYNSIYRYNKYSELLKQAIKNNNYYMTKFLLIHGANICILDYCNTNLMDIARKAACNNICY
jgi:hypothetical protein